MSSLSEELFALAGRLEEVAAQRDKPEIEEPLRQLESAASKVGESWSGSWLGYQSRVYYHEMNPPPPGAHFSPEWGLNESFSPGTVGSWVEFSDAEVESEIYERASNPSLEQAQQYASSAREALEDCRNEILSILMTTTQTSNDAFLSTLLETVKNLESFGSSHFLNYWHPQGEFASRDSLAISQGLQTPPHFTVLAEVLSLLSPGNQCADLSKIARRAGSHLARQARQSQRENEVGTNVFIGHGRSRIWKDLKDFVQDRLHLPWDEFNRVPVAGITNVARLSEMLDYAAVAFLVMTAEDEQADGEWHARMNVVHEAGLFQGRLGFTKAIVLLEEGCAEFSNIEGLGQIRFQEGDISTAFEEIRRVLERERLIE